MYYWQFAHHGKQIQLAIKIKHQYRSSVTDTVSPQEQQSFLQTVFDHLSTNFQRLVLIMLVNGSKSAPVLTTMQMYLFNHPLFGMTIHIQVNFQFMNYIASFFLNVFLLRIFFMLLLSCQDIYHWIIFNISSQYEWVILVIG